MAETVTPTETFEQFLLEQGLIAQPVFDRIKKFVESGGAKHLENISHTEVVLSYLEEQKLFTPEDSAKARSLYYNLPYVDLRKEQMPKNVVDIMPVESLVFYKIAPFKLDGNKLSVAVLDPGNLQTLQALEFLGQKQNMQIEVYLASIDSIEALTGQKKQMKNVVGQALEEIQVKEEGSGNKQKSKFEQIDESILKDAPIVKIVDVILSNAIEGNASDIHIEPSEKEVKVRYRIDGILHNSLALPKNVHAAIVTRIKIMCNMKIDESRLPQDGRFHFEVGSKSVDLRVSVIPLIYGEKIVMRILDKTGDVPTLEKIGLSGTNLQWVKENIKKTHGVFLITGPTGSGKSTTLYSLLSLLNTQGTNITTLEDPVEYFIPGVNQSQINPEIGFTFASGLRTILRQDPNVIMVGEIRDMETAELSVHAALTGHLVFSTLHTNSSFGAMPRLIDMGIEPFLLTASVNVVCAQRLVRKICDDCKHEEKVSETLQKFIDEELPNIPEVYLADLDKKNLKAYRGAGCEKCEHTGYRGRWGIFEVLPISQEVQQLVFDKAPISKYLELAKKIGMITIRQDGVVKVLHGQTTIEEVLRVTSE